MNPRNRLAMFIRTRSALLSLRTDLAVDSWANPGAFDHASFVSHLPPGYVPRPPRTIFDPPNFDPSKHELSPDKWGPAQGPTGCEVLPFDPSIKVEPDTTSLILRVGLEFMLSCRRTGWTTRRAWRLRI